MSQTKKESIIEACVNTFVGFIITMLVQYPLYWLFNVKISNIQMWGITAVMTIISILRGYVIRRYFNNLEKPKSWLKKLLIKSN